MVPENLDKTDLEHVVFLLKAAQNSVIHIRQHPNQNGTIDISTLDNSDDIDRPDPLRLPEILIVISVLLLWCGSIFMFIRHSELLRIRHRDLPFRSSVKSLMNLNHISVVNRASDIVIHSKSGLSSTGGLTPPIGNNMFHGYRHDEIMETISLAILPASGQRRHTHSYDFNASSSIKYSSNKSNDQEHLLHPHRISSDIKRSFLDLHRKSVDNIHRKSMNNLSTKKYSTCYSANDILRRKESDTRNLIGKKRCAQEAPV